MKTERLTTKIAAFTGRLPAEQSKPTPSPYLPTDHAPRTLRVEGTGEAKAEPDEGWVDVAVETRAPTAKAAGEENARRTQQVIAALTAAGIDRKDIDTQYYTIYPEYSPPKPDSEPRLLGYRVSNTLSVHTRELARMGDIIDRALAAGADRVDSLRFALSHEDAVRAEALRQAAERAHRQAEVLASSLGIRLGPVQDVSTVAEGSPRSFASLSKSESSTPIQPGEQTLTARVTVVYSIEA